MASPTAPRWRRLRNMRQDFQYALRTLRKSPGFTTIAVLCLALGIGANSAIFTLLDAAVLRTLPVSDPARLVFVSHSFSNPQYEYMRAHSSSLSGVLAHASIALHLTSGPVTDAPTGELVSDNYFNVLGAQPAVGRTFAPGEEAVALISHRYWQLRFQGDHGVAGRSVALNGLPFTVIGVTPRSFFGTEAGKSPDVFVPLSWCDRLVAGPSRLPLPNSFWLDVIGRMQPGVTQAVASAEADVVYHQGIRDQASRMRPGTVRMLEQRHITLTPAGRGGAGLRDRFGSPLAILLAVTGLVLAIACGNVANLLLARSAARRKEIAVRLALGAGRLRLLRQFAAESIVLSMAGASLGLLFAWWSAQGLAGFLSQTVIDAAPGARVLTFTLGISILTGLLFGAIPGARAVRADLTPALNSQPAGGSLGRHSRFGRVLVAGQVALSLVLLGGAGLFLRTLQNLLSMDAGFHADRVLLVSLNPGLSRYSPERTRTFYGDLLDRVAALPGVRSVSLADRPLLSGSSIDGLSVEGRTPQPGEEMATSLRVVSPRFFETMGIALCAGRDFSPLDRAGAPKVAIINETIARKYFGGVNPIGKRVGLGNTPDMEVVGVIADTRYRGLREAVPNTLYLPLEQSQGGPAGPARTLHVHTAAGPGAIAPAVTAEIQALDRELPAKVSTFTDLIDASLVQERLVATLSAFFGALALLLAAIGLYGVMAFTVARRTREIGVRMSLGANRAAVLQLVLADSLRTVATGVLVGIPASLWLFRLVTRQLYGIAPGDPTTLAAAAAILFALTGLAAYLPARRASQVDPMVALRYE